MVFGVDLLFRKSPRNLLKLLKLLKLLLFGSFWDSGHIHGLMIATNPLLAICWLERLVVKNVNTRWHKFGILAAVCTSNASIPQMGFLR